MKDFKGKVAVITGGASGIGWGLAERCAEEPALREAAKKLKKRGADVLAVPADVSRLTDIEMLAQRTLKFFGGVHLLFNNAGVQAEIGQPVWENTMESWEWVLGVNLWGVIHGLKVFVPIMLKQNTECHIVNTSSMAGLIAEPGMVIYGVTKAGVIKISEGLYLQLKQMNSLIGASVLCPAFVSSRMDDAERNRPEEFRNPGAVAKTSGGPPLQERLRQANRKILMPEESADIVFQAIREGRFYIFTDQIVSDLFKERAENIINGRNPERAKVT
jgi:NAD(P)-dependent dehydrogenase (short-subunit alcohol dehydrogenase family)